MKTKPTNNFEANFLRAEGILNDIKIGLMNLLPEEPTLAKIPSAMAKRTSIKGSRTSNGVARNHSEVATRPGHFGLLNDKP